MKFEEAFEYMLEGEMMARPHWAGYYATILYNQNYMWQIAQAGTTAVINATVYIPSVQDIQANDWIKKG